MILIPGFLSSGAVWDDVVAHYSFRYTCHVLTLPGFAGQPPIAAPILPASAMRSFTTSARKTWSSR